MALSPTQLDKLPESMIKLMSELQDEIISDICRRITKADMLTPTAEWQLYKANQLTISSREVKRRIASKLKVQERELKDLYTDAVKTAIAEDARVYKIAIAEGILSDDYRGKLTNYTRSVAFSNALKRGLKNTNGLMRNLTNSAAAMANRQLSDALDLCYLEVTSGAFTPQEAFFKATKKLGADGIKVVNYASGHTDQLDVAVRRAVVTSIGKTCGDMQLDLAHEMDCQLVEVSSHLGARPSHAEWQGRIYSLVKGHPKYPYFYDATGYGTGDGLCGWHCRHSFFPYFEGLSKPANAPYFSLAENEQVYKDTQKQRSYERAIRKSKRELAALDGARSASDDPALVAKLDREFERKSVTLKRREATLSEHLKATGLLPDNSRVRVDGFGRLVSQKAVHAAKKKRLTSVNGSVIIEETIGRSAGAKAKNYDVLNPKTGEIVNLVEGSHITKPKNCIMAGKGRERQIDDIDWLVSKYGGKPEEWQKVKGFGYIYDEYGEERKVELHWYENPECGKVEMKIKVRGGEIYIDDD